MINKHFVTPTSGIKVRFVGTVDLKLLYKYMKIYLEDKGFAKAENLEKSYTERVKPDGKQIEIVWECTKKINDYFKYNLKVLFLLLNINSVEVQKENYKVKLLKGDFEIHIIGWVEEGSEEWDNLGPLAKVYHKLIARKRVDDNINKLYDSVVSFQEHIKKSLQLRT